MEPTLQLSMKIPWPLALISRWVTGLILAGVFRKRLFRGVAGGDRDRAETIYADTELHYRRVIEDLEGLARKRLREREMLLDHESVDFHPKTFVERDLAIAVQLRNLDIKTELARRRYEHLFGRKGNK